MDAETQRQIQELEEQQDAHRRRLQVLEVRAATYGMSAPPEVITEIGEIKAKLVPIDAAIFKLTYVGAVRADVPGNERGDRQGIAIERALERQRRDSVAEARIAEAARNARLDTAIAAMRQALLAIGSIAVLALVLVVILGTYIVTRHGL